MSAYIIAMNNIESGANLSASQRDKVEAKYSRLVAQVKSGLLMPYEAVVTFLNYVQVVSYANQY